MLSKKDLEIFKYQYAHLIVTFGLNIKKGEVVEARLTMDDPIFNQLLVKECYLAGAKRVIVHYLDPMMDRLHYIYGDLEEMKKVYPFDLELRKFLAKNHTPSLCSYPIAFKESEGVDQKKANTIREARMKVIYPYYYEQSYKSHWSGFVVPNTEWAKKVFPKLSEEEGLNKLWELIFKCSHLNKKDSVKAWKEHNNDLKQRAKWLDSLQIKTLHYENKLGTDLTIGLLKDTHFVGGTHDYHDGTGAFNPNFPTEEVFTCPDKYATNGIVYASKPVIIDGVMVKDFYLKFKNGKVIEAKAKENQARLLSELKVDKGASYLGEVAIVPITSPINEAGILFYNTLFDENASCHLAFGGAFNVVLKNGVNKTSKDLEKLGLNQSKTHIDFMIGTPDLKITATTRDNKKIVIFKNGQWALLK